jgi:hypothetical protein
MTRISFGIIALNAQPFLERNLQALYPFAHQIIVVEGAIKAAQSLARPDGHSSDGTLEMLKQFRAASDPDKKLTLISAADEGYTDGYWPEKNEMSQAYAKRITGDWLWQVDSDEFYLEEDITAISKLLENDPNLATISFPYYEFFGSFGSVLSGVWHLYVQPRADRIFRWKAGYQYKSHRPPTVLDERGIDLRNKGWQPNPKNHGEPIYLFHYSYVLPKQAEQKVGYYSNVEWTDVFRENQGWMQNSFLSLKNPMFLGEHGWPNLQWLEKFTGEHPKAINELRQDLLSGKITERTRPNSDIERLLSSKIYSIEKGLARFVLAFYWPLRTLWKRIRSRILGVPHVTPSI